MSRSLSINIVVQGRFHAFALAKALIAKGADVKVLTSYPAFTAKNFGLDPANVTGFPALGLLHRYSYRWDLVRRFPALERVLHQGFSTWALRQIRRREPDVVHAFSGVALEIYRDLEARRRPCLRMLTRGSAHIRDQFKDLYLESKRSLSDIEMPSAWMMQRERKEYQVADKIVALSSFARNSFLRRGYPADKIFRLSLGSNVSQFRPEREVVDARLSRIRSGARLKVVFTGNVSLQKGVLDMITVASALRDRMDIQLVGNVTPDAASRLQKHHSLFQMVPRVPEQQLPSIHNEADVYFFPTLHDGFAAVLAQAAAACLPIICTDHCAGPDIVEQGQTGWVLPIRSPQLFIERLIWCDENREELAQIVESLWQRSWRRDWAQVADDFMVMVEAAHKRHISLKQNCNQ